MQDGVEQGALGYGQLALILEGQNDNARQHI